MIDLYDHVEEFEAHMDAFNAENEAKCKAFPITLEGNTVNWFRSLPAGFITYFENLRYVFITKFLSSQKHPLTDASLLLVKQKPDESIRSYAKRFSNIHSQVNDPNEKLAIQGLELGATTRTSISSSVQRWRCLSTDY